MACGHAGGFFTRQSPRPAPPGRKCELSAQACLKEPPFPAIVCVSPTPLVAGRPLNQENCVAHTLSARKRVRQTAKRRERNRDRKREIRLELKKMQAAIAGGDKAAAAAELKKAQQVLDRIAARGSIHPNTAARRKSRMARKINALSAAK